MRCSALASVPHQTAPDNAARVHDVNLLGLSGSGYASRVHAVNLFWFDRGYRFSVSQCQDNHVNPRDGRAVLAARGMC
jgi:hypothetical protein